LVDANMIEIDLLSPMYISVSIKPIEINEELKGVDINTANTMTYMNELKSNEQKFAELRNFDILSTMDIDDRERIIGRNDQK
jgi:hypothetical protein